MSGERGHQVELGEFGYVIRRPDGSFYNGLWRAKRIAVLACGALNSTGQIPPGWQPDLLLRDEVGR